MCGMRVSCLIYLLGFKFYVFAWCFTTGMFMGCKTPLLFHHCRRLLFVSVCVFVFVDVDERYLPT